MKALVLSFVFLLIVPTAYGQIMIETPTGERRLRYELCDERRSCRMVEQTMSYLVCDEHHNCQTVDAIESGKAKIWDQEELARSGTFVFSVPGWL